MKKQEFDILVERMIKANAWNFAGFLSQFTSLVELFDKDRAPVADAAWFLYGTRGVSEKWLCFQSGLDVETLAKSLGEVAFKAGATIQGRKLGGFVIGFGEFVLDPSFPIFYPDRQATADAAEFLVTRVGVGSYWLKNVGAQHIRADAKEFESMLKAREVNVRITINRLVEGDSGGYVDLKFFKGDVKVGDVRITGKTKYPYERTIALSGDYDQVRCESSPSARYSFERVKK